MRAAAEKTLAAPPEQLVNSALGADLHPAVIDALARTLVDRRDVLEKLLAMPRVDMETVEHVARHGSESVSEGSIATNEERLLMANPRIIEQLYFNKNTRHASTTDRLVDLAVRNERGAERSIPAFKRTATLALQGELIPEATDEASPDDLLFQETEQLSRELDTGDEEEDTHVEDELGEETLKEKFQPLYARLSSMTMTQKIRRAMIGTKEERMLLVRDSNHVISSAAIRSPLMKDNEVVLITRNKNISDDVLRVISSKPEWLKSYTVKKNLVENPKTPVSVASRLVQHLREADLRERLQEQEASPGPSRTRPAATSTAARPEDPA